MVKSDKLKTFPSYFLKQNLQNIYGEAYMKDVHATREALLDKISFAYLTCIL